MTGPAGRKRPWYAKALLSLLAVMAALALAEAAARYEFKWPPARISPPGFGWMEITPAGLRLVPDTHIDRYNAARGGTFRLDINARGLRGPEIMADHRGRARVLVLGDSIVFGPGLDNDQTLPARLGSALGPRAEVLNAGVPGMSLRDEVDYFEELDGPLRPAVVVLGFYLNDPLRSYVLTSEYGHLSDFWVVHLTRARQSSVLFNRLWEGLFAAWLVKTQGLNTGWVAPFEERRWVTDREVYRRMIAEAGDDFGAAWDPRSWPEVRAQFMRLKERCGRSGSRLAIVIFPVSIQVQSQVADTYPQDQMAALARELGLPRFDPLPLYRAWARPDLFADQCHLTPVGADLTAQALAEWMTAQGLP
jgi:hypothetical protein